MTDLGTACCNGSGWLVTFDPKVRYIKGYYADFKQRMAKEEAKGGDGGSGLLGRLGQGEVIGVVAGFARGAAL